MTLCLILHACTHTCTIIDMGMNLSNRGQVPAEAVCAQFKLILYRKAWIQYHLSQGIGKIVRQTKLSSFGEQAGGEK